MSSHLNHTKSSSKKDNKDKEKEREQKKTKQYKKKYSNKDDDDDEEDIEETSSSSNSEEEDDDEYETYSSEDEVDEDEEEETYSEDEEEPKFSKSAFKKAFMELLPSSSSSSGQELPKKKHKKNRKNISDTESEEEKEKHPRRKDKEKKHTEKKKEKKHTEKKKEKKHNKKKEESDSESSDSDYIDSKENSGSDEDDDDDMYEHEDKDESGMKTLSFILSMGDGMTTVDEEYEKILKEDKHEVCNSDDEKTFMKETYLPISIPSLLNDNNTSSSSSNIKDKKKFNKKIRNNNNNNENDHNNKHSSKKEKHKEKEKDILEEHANSVTKKYIELTQLKKDLTEQLEKKPNSKILRNAIQECRDSISKLIKKARNKNTKEYYKLVNGDEEEQQNNGELVYFKKKCSHKEQMKIMQDLKEINAFTNIDKPYRLSLLESNIPAKYKAVVLQKLKILRTMEPGDSEYFKLKNWVDGFMRVPFGKYKELNVNINDGLDACHSFIENAKNTLDNCTYGLNDAKLQILQMVGQWISNPSAMGTSIAIHGPPGTGKTTIVKDGISKILGREFAFIALGGAGDSSFLEGHSYTYEGSCWGKIIQILMDSKCMNPVIYFDELDKISETPRGEEITNILVHLTDITQNDEYHDKYFSEVSFRLSQCLFIFSYNDESKINPVLKDRMYRIHTKGYDAKEKVIIARKHLLPKIREQVNFKEGDIDITDDTLNYIITNERLCKGEQGVRNLKRCLEIIHTKLNLFRLIKTDVKLFEKEINLGDEVVFPFVVTRKHVDILIKHEEPMNHSMLAMYV
jgi:ATP-dependent Lon protease